MGKLLGSRDTVLRIRRIPRYGRCSMDGVPDSRPGDYGRTLAPVGFAYATSAIWCLGWFLLRPASKPNHFFREGGPIDLLDSVWMVAAALLAWCAWMIGRGSRLRWFWFVTAIGCFLLALDERFQAHEVISRMPETGEPPLGFRNWTDVIVLGYGVVAVLVLLPVARTLWAARGLRMRGILMFTFAALSAGIDTLVASGPTKDLVEETFKLLFGASLFLVALEGFTVEVRRRAGSPWTRRLPGWVAATFLIVLCLAMGFLLLGGPERWQELMSRYWGSAHSWLVCVLLWSAALFTLMGWLHVPRAEREPLVFWLMLAGFLGFLGFGEGIRATRIRTMHDRVADTWPGSQGIELAVLHDPLSVTRVLVLLVFGGLLALATTRAARASAGHRWLTAAAVLLPASLLWNLLGGDAANDVFAPFVRIVGAACALLGAMTWFLDQARGACAPPTT